MTRARFLVGIDLGTTNSSVAFVDLEREAEGRPRAALLPIAQLIAPGEVTALDGLPSFLYFPSPEERARGISPPAWSRTPDLIVGAWARDQGALRPAAQVSSAKSWLCHPTADRSAKLLPWGADVPAVSPVEASARILAHLRDAWNETTSRGRDEWRLERQEVVVAVPASFDQEARELTVQATRQAGLEHVTLLEEPLAAFYAWTAEHQDDLPRRFTHGERVLVCDVGGGTSDFTLIAVALEHGQVKFERIAVGDHLLLGGDNLDLALARHLEQKLGDRALTLVQRLALRRSVSAAKERLLGDPPAGHVPVTILGSGRGLVGGAMTTGLTREEVIEVLTAGFLPVVGPEERPRSDRDRRTGLQEMGLPYAGDAAITRHLAEFLFGQQAGRPDLVLFNGGFFTPRVARDRVVDAIGRWFDPSGTWRPSVLENQSPAAAVALGAATYALVRRRGGLRVRAGSSRAYYLGVGQAHLPTADAGTTAPTALCILPRGTEEGTSFELVGHELMVMTNRPVSFPLYSSATREDGIGELVTLEPGELHQHAPLATVLRYGRRSRHVELAVKLSAAFTETGTLEVSCASLATEHRWRLQFQLRGERQGPEEAHSSDAPGAQVPDDRVQAAQAAITATFEAPSAIAATSAAGTEEHSPDTLPARLETTLGFGKLAWPTPVIRALADTLLPLSARRRRSPRYEARWLNLLGFCLRPGFGAPLDDWRVGRTRGLYVEGLAFSADPQCQVEWIVLWQRVAGGLRTGQQRELYQRYATLLGIRGSKGTRRLNPQVQREAWRLLASLEHLSALEREHLGEALLDRLRRDPGNASFLWAMARLGARTPAYGPLGAVVPAERASAWLARLLDAGTLTAERAASIAQVAALTGDPLRDLPEPARQEAASRLRAAAFPGEAEALLTIQPAAGRSALQLFGESLPEGLRLSGVRP